jgi:putative aldouronate transport system substrate-binding protein
MKRRIAFILSFAMLFCLFTACNIDKSDSAATNGTAETTDPETFEERYKITVVGPTAAPYDNNSDMVKYFTENSNIDWDMQYIESAKAVEIMNLRFASGDIPDVYSNLGYVRFYDLVNEGIGGTIPEKLLRSAAPNIAKYFDELGDNCWAVAKHENGEIFTFPGVNAEYMYGSAIIWRQSWLDKLGEEIPKTLSDAERIFYKFAKEDPDGNEKDDTYGLSADGMTQVFRAYGVADIFEDENGMLQYPVCSSKYKEALELLAKWYKDGILDPEYITGENKGGYSALSHSFCSGRIGFTARGINNHWRPVEWIKEYPSIPPFANQELFNQTFPDETYTYGWPLEGPYGDKSTGFIRYSYWSGFSKKFTDDVPKLTAFLKFVEWSNGFNNPEDYLLVRYGIKGKHWDYDENNTPAYKEGYRTPDEQYGAGLVCVFNFTNYYHAVNLANPFYSSWRDKLYTEPGRSIMNKSYFVRSLPSAAEFSELTKLQEEFNVDVITGKRFASDYDDFLAQWRKMGGDKMTKEANDIRIDK